MAKINNSKNNTILSGSGTADSIYNTGDNVTIYAGAGHDLISLNSGAANNVITYKDGDGLDTVCGFDGNDTLQISGSYSTQKSGSNIVVTVDNNLILTVGDNNITLKNAATLKAVNIIGAIDDPTYLELTNSDKTPMTLVAEVITADASARTKAIKITGNKLDNSIVGGTGKDSLSGGDGDDTIEGGKGNDSINGGNGNDSIDGGAGNDKLLGGAGNDTLIGGVGNDTFTSGSGNDLIIYEAGNDLITDMSATDTLQIGDGTASYSKDTVDNNLILTVGDNNITLKNAATLKAVNIIGAIDDLTYLKLTNSDKTPMTLGAEVITADASARTKAIKITGNKLDNSIVGGTGKDSISGGSGDDTIEGGKGNDSLKGGAGADVFVYKSGDGNDIITDYAEEDVISVTGGTVSKATVSGSNVILTVGSGKITVKGGKDKIISYVNNGGEHTYSNVVNFDSDGTGATLLSGYTKKTFDATDYGDYVGTLKTINASAVMQNISITGNANANQIIGSKNKDYLRGENGKDTLVGGDGNDTLEGGAGNDSLIGGDGVDVFIYAEGDGNDVIHDYAEGEKISITSGTVSKKSTSGNNVILTIGAGKITVKDAVKNKVIITYWDEDGKNTYEPSAKDLLLDDNYSTDAAQLSTIIQPDSASYTPYNFDASLALVAEEKFRGVFSTEMGCAIMNSSKPKD